MAIKIVTGSQEDPHVTANDDGSFHQGVVGTKDYVLGVGKKAKATLVSNNSVRIDDGELVMQGVHFRILPGTYENVTINNGNQGMKRKDMIVARYTKDSETGIENVTLDVLQGTPTSGTDVAPVPTTGDIRSGTLKHEMPLYVVELNGLNVVSVDPAFDILMSAKEMKDRFEVLDSKLFFKSGDSISIFGKAGGYFTSGGRDLVFSVPVGKSLELINSAKITEAKLLVRQNDSYCIGTGNGHETLNLSTDNPRATLSKDNGSLDIGFTFPRGRASVNNDACGVDYKMKLTLS